VFRFSDSLPFRIHTHTQLIIIKRGPLLASDGRHSMIFIEDLARASSPCRLGTFSFADGEQVSHLSTCQKEKLIILYVHVLAPRTTLILQGGKWPTIALAYGQFRLVCLLALTAGYFFLIRCVDLHCTRSFNPITRQITSINYPLYIERLTELFFLFSLSGSFLSFIPFHLLFFPPHPPFFFLFF
jgi:hypothetical protein